MTRGNIFIALALLILCNSCEKKDPIIPNEEEVITTVNYKLTSVTGEQVLLQFKDLNGGINPIIISGKLKENSTYTGSLELLNELGPGVDDITSEIIEEGVDHQFFYEHSVPDMTIVTIDTDENMDPLGVETMLVTKGKGTGTIKITLRHLPNKSGVGVAEGLIDNAGGETDIEVIFDINVE